MDKELLISKIIDYNYCEFGNEYGDTLVDLRNNYVDLQQRIDKAVEYINENWGHWCSNHVKYATETINILKGDE